MEFLQVLHNAGGLLHRNCGPANNRRKRLSGFFDIDQLRHTGDPEHPLPHASGSSFSSALGVVSRNNVMLVHILDRNLSPFWSQPPSTLSDNDVFRKPRRCACVADRHSLCIIRCALYVSCIRPLFIGPVEGRRQRLIARAEGF